MTRNVASTIHMKVIELQKNVTLLISEAKDINKENLKKDLLKYWGVERGIQISIECVLDISNIIISSLNTEKPDTYREAILILSKEQIYPSEFAKKISNMVSFRNILVHDYMKIDEDIILDILHNHLEDFVKFIEYINKWVEANY